MWKLHSHLTAMLTKQEFTAELSLSLHRSACTCEWKNMSMCSYIRRLWQRAFVFIMWKEPAIGTQHKQSVLVVLLNVFIKDSWWSTFSIPTHMWMAPQWSGLAASYCFTPELPFYTQKKKVQVFLPTSLSIYKELATESFKVKITSIMQCMTLRHQKKCSFSFMLHFHNGKLKEH